MTKTEFKDLWARVVELVEDSEFCDEFRNDEDWDDELLNVINYHLVDNKLDKSNVNVQKFLTEIHWATSEFYNFQYADEAPGGRESHRSGYKKSIKASKRVLMEIINPA